MFKKLFYVLSVILMFSGCDDSEPKPCPVYAADSSSIVNMTSVPAFVNIVATGLVLDGAIYESVGGGASGNINEYYDMDLDVMNIEANKIEDQFFDIQIFYDRNSFEVQKVLLHINEGALPESTWFSCIGEDCSGITYVQNSRSLHLDHVVLNEEGGAGQETLTGKFSFTVQEAPNHGYIDTNCY